MWCPVCDCSSTSYANISGFAYFECSGCGIIHIDPLVIAQIDGGKQLVEYRSDYWKMETEAAEERSRSVGILRFAEAIFLCRRPVRHAIDIGTGTGRLLDHIEHLLPRSSQHIWGVELFPPADEQRTQSTRYVRGTISSVANITFDAGMCMEVVEHLTPTMVRSMLRELAARSNPDSCFFFNTGLAAYTKHEDPGYLDPTNRGHIVSWTVKAFNVLGSPFGLSATELPGRTWAFLVEHTDRPQDIESRLWAPLPTNLTFLNDGKPGQSLLGIAAAESCRGYFNAQRAEERTAWALSLAR
jgi:hypothetical protein